MTRAIQRVPGQLHGVFDAVRNLKDSTAKNDLLTYASAMAYQLVFAMPAVLLAGLAVLGLLGMRDVWDAELGPRLARATSEQVFGFVETTAAQVLAARSGFWLTLGSALAVWYVSGAARALMGVMNSIYGATESRSFWRRMSVSILLSLGSMILFGLAAILLYVAPAVVDHLDLGLGFGIVVQGMRWLLNVSCLYAALYLFVRFGPAQPEALTRGSLTAALIVLGWIGTSLAFRLYVTSVADYRSVFGSLASMMIAMGYVYLSTVVLIYGLQIDAMVRDRAAGEN